MNISLTRNVKAPVRGTSHSAGIDFFVPEFDEQFLADLRQKNEAEIQNNNISILPDLILLKPQGRILIPSGVYVNIEDLVNTIIKNEDECIETGIALIVHNKSSVGTKMGFDRLAEVIDQDYQGEIHLSIVNTGTVTQIIRPGDKLVQMILLPVYYPKLNIVPLDKLYNKPTERGKGGFGSTDKK